MTGALGIAGALLVIAALDAMFAGFRASCGRSGLVRHRPADLLASRRGLALGALLLTPVAAVVATDAARPGRIGLYSAAGRAMLVVYLPYGVVVLLALAAYATLSWRRRFLANALLLGPLTLVRPLVALVGAGAACWVTQDLTVVLVSLAAVAGVLAVEPTAGHRLVRQKRSHLYPLTGQLRPLHRLNDPMASAKGDAARRLVTDHRFDWQNPGGRARV